MAEVHSFLGFNTIIISPASIGIGSVGISPLPIFVTTISTSGKRSFNILAALFVYSIVVVILLPGKIRASTAKSPSSKAGINSPPKRDITKTAIVKSESTTAKIIVRTFKALIKYF